MKDLLAVARIEGHPDDLERITLDQRSQLDGCTAGGVKTRLHERFVVADVDAPEFDEQPPDGHDGAWVVATRIFRTAPETRDEWNRELATLVRQRNDFVHSFDTICDLDSLEACQRNSERLRELTDEVERQRARYLGPSEYFEQARQDFARIAETEEYKRLLNEGITPDGSINWPATPIVRALYEATEDVADDDWLSIESARLWVEQHYPNLAPASVNCKTWKEVIHRSGQFEIRRIDEEGKRIRQYRPRPGIDRSIEVMIAF